MKTARLRAITRKYNNVGYALVGAYLLARFAWQRRRTLIPVCASCAVCSALAMVCLSRYRQAGNASAQAQYTVASLGTLPDATECEARGLNNRGQAVGVCAFANGVRHAFLWQDGKMRNLGAGNGSSIAYSINNAGLIAGENEGEACVWRNGKAQLLGALPGYGAGSARAISGKGDVAGYCFHRPEAGKAFRWQNGKMTPIEPAGEEDFTIAAGINDRSDVVGETASEWGDTRAFVNVVGSRYAEPLPTLGGPNNAATAINNRDEIVGFSNHLRGDRAAFHAFLWRSGKVRDLGVLGGVRSTALAINDKGLITGWSEASGYKQHAFVWQSGKMHDLNALLPPNSGWILEQASGINDNGLIVGTGLHNGKRRAFLLTPRH